MKKTFFLEKGKVYYNSEKACESFLKGTPLSEVNIYDPKEKEIFEKTCEKLGVEIDLNIEDEMKDYNDEYIENLSKEWLIPKKYLDMSIEDIIDFFLSKTKTEKEKNRVIEEIESFSKINGLNFLKSLIYISDVIKNNRIVTGVGRGSSVSLFTLYLIGLHKVNSLEYDLDPNEFFKFKK